MRRFRFFLPALVLLAGAALFVMGPAARADFTLTVTIYEDGNQVGSLTNTVSSGINAVTVGTVSGTAYGDFTISSASAKSNAPGNAVLNAFVSQGGGSVEVSNTGSADHIFAIVASANNFTLGAGAPFPMSLIDAGSGTLLGGSATNGSLNAYLDTSNAIATAAGGPSGGTVTSAGPLTFNLVGAGASFGPASISKSVDLSSASVYSLTTVETFTLSAGGVMDFTGSQAVSAVPGPNTLALAGAALLGLGGFVIWRRRQVLPVSC